ncbi:MAG TPA: VOC family protein [Terracidiphilus sp.]|jgi:catechol 2,3-dioxygenase-like lactoylglutathione lyase family enzyme
MRSKLVLAAGVAALSVAVVALNAQERPKITGVSHIAVYASDAAATEHYYTHVLGAQKALDPENARGARYFFSADQYVEVLPLPADAGKNRLDHIAFHVSDAEKMRKFLEAKGWHVPTSVSAGKDGSQWFEVFDPEGNRVQFEAPGPRLKSLDAPLAISHHIIHVGILIHDRATEDSFYRGLLGFAPYWYGGMQDTKIDWVSQQVPDGHDWLEYMVAGGPGKGIPDSMSEQTLGVLNHFALGETSVESAFKTLQAGNRLEGRHDATPKTGRDGKQQFNMYDPDGTRAELMNLHATDKPCCSPFTAQDPAE